MSWVDADWTRWSAADPADPVVVVGAGIVGMAAAWHLVRSGATDVTVVDALQPAGATTAAGAGFVNTWSAGAVDFHEAALPLQRYALDFYRDLAAGSRGIGYRANGNLVLATTEAAWTGAVRPIADHPLASSGTRSLTPGEIARLTGVVNPDAVVGGVLMPGGIQVETDLATAALVDQVTSRGGKLRLGAPVTELTVTGTEVTAVRTAAGTSLRVGSLVLAAGAWTNELVGILGPTLPLLRLVATRIVGNPAGVPPSLPTIQCHGFPLWIREKDGGFTWGTSKGYAPAMDSERRCGSLRPGRPEDRSLAASVMSDLAALDELFPGVAAAGIRSWIQGIPVHTLDGQLVAGRLPGYVNVVVLCGDNESGVTHGPGLGRIAADLVRTGVTGVDLTPFLPDRFGPDSIRTEEELAAARAAAMLE